ncbi:MAG: SusC/RagA family TonB-linked outer membrane protein [Candidatus Pseudobacter hemicellulosilyticus]|uniref:SusC/RagA family TonB-linked outer membrane protein n=1 Tax=Candidatus Pseudobacter hemicellulosilyticus TaxID=3121375 RepID=A0AAJ6BG50_9BACT|nr:MAG: SusC/RagA family TonB-linked outer membrane protein [Pseudobacter sp.]
MPMIACSRSTAPPCPSMPGQQPAFVYRPLTARFFLSCLFLLVCASSLFARPTDTGVNINERNAPLERIFELIKSQTGYNFVYTEGFFKKARKVSIKVKDATLKDVLEICLRDQSFTYTILEADRLVVIREKEPVPVPMPLTVLLPKDIKGTVSNEKGEPIAGATINVKGSQQSAVTNEQGVFTLNGIADNAVLVVSNIGYDTKEIPVAGKTEVSIQLTIKIGALDDIVVIGYGTQRRAEVSTAISSVKAKDFVKGAVGDAAQLIRGKVAGLAVITPDGNPTATAQIKLRGVNSIANSASALILIDGVPGSFTSVAPEDIESIDVLKDGAAAAIYGTRGTGGVILITTRKVNGETPPTIDVNTYVTTQSITRKLDFMSADQYRELVAQGKPGAYDFGSNTNWLDEITRTPVSQVYNMSLRAGNRSTNYIVSMEYRKLQGIIDKSNNTVFFPRLEVNHAMFNNKLKLNMNVQGYAQSFNAISDGGSYRGDIYRNGITYNPTDPVRQPNGSWTQHTDKTDYVNPLSLLEETKGKNLNNSLRTIGSATFRPVTGLTLKLLGSRDLYNSVRGYYETKQHISTIRDGRNGFASRGTTRTTDDLMELTGEYARTLGDHQLTGLVGYSWRKYYSENYWMQNWDFPTDFYSYNNMGSGKALSRGQAPESSVAEESKLIGAFARINYNFRNRYLLMASIRREGSTRFGTDHKVGNFPAVSAGWDIAGENFMQKLAAVSMLKLRVGYGVTGTEPERMYRSLNLINFNSFAYHNGEWIQVVSQASNPNPDLRWEKKEEVNLGLDFGFLNNRITGSVDVYKRTIRDMIFYDYPVPVVPYLFNTITANAATMWNRGIEVVVNATAIESGKFSWNTSVNYAFNENKVTSFTNNRFQTLNRPMDVGSTGEPIQSTTHRLELNAPVGNFFGYRAVDIDDNGHWLIMGKDGKPKPIAQQQPDDKQVLGNGLPTQYLNFNNTFTYGNFDLNITMRGAFNFEILNMARMFYGVPSALNRGNVLTSAYDDIYGKRPLADNQEQQYVSYFIEKGDYWKIDNVTLGYNVPVSAAFVKRVRVYAAASNLATFTGYSGIDPEVSVGGTAPGVDDRNRYPAVRSFTFGAYLTF